MLGSSTQPITLPHDASAMAARQTDGHNSRHIFMWCEHCQNPYHTKATCWISHGNFVDWVPLSQRGVDRKGGVDGNGLQAPSKSKNSSYFSFSKAQLDQLGKLLSSSSLMAQDTSNSSLTNQINTGEPWIIDSRASDHVLGSISALIHMPLIPVPK